ACPGRGGYAMARQAGSVLEETRCLLAELLGVKEPNRFIFTLNATDALNLAIKGVLVPGDHVVTTVFEHNSVMRPLNRMEQLGFIRVSRVGGSSNGLVDPHEIYRALTPRTKLVAVVHGSNATGALQPIESIGRLVRQHGALFLVDAAQTAGAVPIDVHKAAIDLLAFPGHKALLGLPGTGALYIGSRARLAPWREGGTGIFSELPLQPEVMPYAYEAGSPNTLGLAGLRESLRFILRYGVAWVRTHELSLTEYFIKGLGRDGRFVLHGPSSLKDRIAVISVSLQNVSPAVIADYLDRYYGIAVRAGLHCAPGAHRFMQTFPEGTVRISPGYFNTLEEIDTCLQALREAADQLFENQVRVESAVPERNLLPYAKAGEAY
ncbi:MAG: aminotransferase class V-fold PLP-dependent enzyme, partial [Candidatus Omnitrophica bacterium]|nr:aminotransferase class V-fold PLP-dependent enzyme [Candidatus Omnitrophota bacterium]